MKDQIPFISIIIPCRNEEKCIEHCLQSILTNIPAGAGLEILVIDGVSNDRTKLIVSEIIKEHTNIKLLDNPAKIQAAGMNIGIKAAKGDIIVRLDAHSEYGHTYIKDCVDLLLKSDAVNAGGRLVTIPNGNGIMGVPFSRITSHPFGVGHAPFRTGAAAKFVDTVPFGTFKRSIFDQVGYYDERLTRNEDNEFNSRIVKAGYKIAFDPAIEIIYKHQSRLKGILFHTFYSSMWNVYDFFLHPHVWRTKRFIPLLFLIYILLLGILGPLLPPLLFLIMGTPLLFYIGLISWASFSPKYDLKTNLLTFVTFFVYHMTYGFGILVGLLQIITGGWKNQLGKPVR